MNSPRSVIWIAPELWYKEPETVLFGPVWAIIIKCTRMYIHTCISTYVQHQWLLLSVTKLRLKSGLFDFFLLVLLFFLLSPWHIECEYLLLIFDICFSFRLNENRFMSPPLIKHSHTCACVNTDTHTSISSQNTHTCMLSSVVSTQAQHKHKWQTLTCIICHA